MARTSVPPSGTDHIDEVALSLRLADRLVRAGRFEAALEKIEVARARDPKNRYAIAYEERIKTLLASKPAVPPRPEIASLPVGTNDEPTTRLRPAFRTVGRPREDAFVPESSEPMPTHAPAAPAPQESIPPTSTDPKTSAILKRARRFEREEDYERAFAELARALLRDPASAEILQAQQRVQRVLDERRSVLAAELEESEESEKRRRQEFIHAQANSTRSLKSVSRTSGERALRSEPVDHKDSNDEDQRRQEEDALREAESVRMRRENNERRARLEEERRQAEAERKRLEEEQERLRAEQAQHRAEIERLKREQEEKRLRAQDELRRAAAEQLAKENEARRRQEEEAKRRQEEEAKRRAEAERQRKEEEEKRLRIQEELKRARERLTQEAEAKRRQEEDAKRQTEVQRLLQERDEDRRRQEETLRREATSRLVREIQDQRMRSEDRRKEEADRERREAEEARRREEEALRQEQIAKLKRELEQKRIREEEERQEEIRYQIDQGLQRARQFLAGNHFDEALRALAFGMAADPGNETLRRMSEEIREARDRARREQAEFERRKEEAERRPGEEAAQSIRAHIDDADSLAAQNRFNEALRAVARAYALDPLNPEIRSCEMRVVSAMEELRRQQEEARKQRERDQEMKKAEEFRLLVESQRERAIRELSGAGGASKKKGRIRQGMRPYRSPGNGT